MFKKKRCSKEAIDLIDKMLTLDPSRRISAEQALETDFFKNPPEPDSNWK